MSVVENRKIEENTHTHTVLLKSLLFSLPMESCIDQ